jgi:hypothetical protein
MHSSSKRTAIGPAALDVRLDFGAGALAVLACAARDQLRRLVGTRT